MHFRATNSVREFVLPSKQQVDMLSWQKVKLHQKFETHPPEEHTFDT